MALYAIISVGGSQYRVSEGQRLLVDRIPQDEKKTFHPAILFVGGDGKAELGPKNTHVTARVIEHVRGPKIRVGKYRQRTGYRRHTGHRSELTEIEIESIGTTQTRARKAPAEQEEPEEQKEPEEKKAATMKKESPSAAKPRAKAGSSKTSEEKRK
jgi:large subunit ribosomal protein L21